MDAQLIANSIIAGAIYTLYALGFAFVFRVCKFFHLAHGGVLVVGAYIAYGLCYWGVPFCLSLTASACICAVIGLAMYKGIYQWMERRRAPKLVYLMASLGLLLILQNTVAALFSNETRTFTRFPSVLPGFELLGAVVTPLQATLLGVAVFLVIGLTLLEGTSFGRKMRAAGDNRGLAEVFGIDTGRVMLITFAIGSALAAIGGGLVARESTLRPSMGFVAGLYAVVVSIIGGSRSTIRVFAAAMVLGLAESVAVEYVGSNWKTSVALGVLMLVLAVRSRGLSWQEAIYQET